MDRNIELMPYNKIMGMNTLYIAASWCIGVIKHKMICFPDVVILYTTPIRTDDVR
jgi:hypothetical protein